MPQEHIPSQQQEPMLIEQLPNSRVFEDISADYFSSFGKDFLVYFDNLSG